MLETRTILVDQPERSGIVTATRPLWLQVHMKKKKGEHKKDPVAVEMGRRGGKKGGKNRMAMLSPEQRSELGRRAAHAKRAALVGEGIAEAQAEGILPNFNIPCAVLKDERRVLSRRGVGRALSMGRGSRGSTNEGGAETPFFLSAKNLQPYVSDDLREALKKPILYRGDGGLTYGLEAEMLPKVFEVWVKASDAGVLKKQQQPIAVLARSLLSALAGVAMVALVDSATGYERVRSSDDLARILERFIAKELQGYARTFEPDFYYHLFRLQNWKYDPASVLRPRRAAALTIDLVYQRLAPQVCDELKSLAKKYQLDRNLKYQPHLHRGLTKEHGWVRLREHLASVTTLMDIAPDWEWFKQKLDQRHPRYGKTMLLPFRKELKEPT